MIDVSVSQTGVKSANIALVFKKDKKTQRPVSIILMPQKSTKGVSSVKCLATSKKFFLNISAGSVKV